ncbi:sulfite exporter TauE/SafE family protein [Psychrobacter sp. I-STPA10]|uniref:sulfite exporter TauE/SafE family protein n=1 Tax=Psychrobacter sp. I-STPA10 TaxID=2585769 RepID=UPI001E481070|nr:sulfite exporter TauE/SafE family protein [Psychrobacter sp. I-STPA10]
MTMLLWFVLAGMFAGVCAGLFGIGGGMIIVPALVWIFTAYGYSPEVVAHLAVGTSLATIIVTSISSLMAHNKRGSVRWDVWKYMAGGLVIGSVSGAAIADQINGQMLQAMIGAAALLVAFKMLFLSNKEQVGKPLPKPPVQFGAGTGIGLASAIFGIGGGSLTVPFLNWSGLPMRQSVGTSAACGLPIAVAGALGFAWFGQDVANLPAGTIGFVNITGFICISIASFITAKLGAKWAHQLPAATLKKAFGVLLTFAGGQLLWSGLAGMGIL